MDAYMSSHPTVQQHVHLSAFEKERDIPLRVQEHLLEN
jgi:hypothetical protein